jgi:hypothetical protein
LDEKEAKHAGLAQQNDFASTFVHKMLKLAKCTAKPNTYC